MECLTIYARRACEKRTRPRKRRGKLRSKRRVSRCGREKNPTGPSENRTRGVVSPTTRNCVAETKKKKNDSRHPVKRVQTSTCTRPEVPTEKSVTSRRRVKQTARLGTRRGAVTTTHASSFRTRHAYLHATRVDAVGLVGGGGRNDIVRR